jgi:two-component system, OmpR family, response regulator
MPRLSVTTQRWTTRSMSLRGRAPRILIVDDNSESADALATYLGLISLTAQASYDGAAAILKAADWVPDVVLLDISMPEVTGFQVATALRANPRTSHVIIIAVTAHEEQYVRERSSHADFDAYCQKGLILEPLFTLLTGLSEGAVTRSAAGPANKYEVGGRTAFF